MAYYDYMNAPQSVRNTIPDSLYQNQYNSAPQGINSAMTAYGASMQPYNQQPFNPYNQIQPNNRQPNKIPQNFMVRVVTGYEEVAATPIPLDGTICLFVDVPNKKIYSKQLNMDDGSALYGVYNKVDTNQPVKQEEKETDVTLEKEPKDFVERTEFDSFKQQITEALALIANNDKQPEAQAQNSNGTKSNVKGRN